MRRWMWGTFLLGAVLVGAWTAARAEYPSSSRIRSDRPGSFEEAVDLEKFRKGNPDWDTQELLRSGLTALHREHLKILEELKGLQMRLTQLEYRMSESQESP